LVAIGQSLSAPLCRSKKFLTKNFTIMKTQLQLKIIGMLLWQCFFSTVSFGQALYHGSPQLINSNALGTGIINDIQSILIPFLPDLLEASRIVRSLAFLLHRYAALP
jgi:hypothetical protein